MTENMQLPSVMHPIGMESEPWAIGADDLDKLIKRGWSAFDRLSSKDAPSALEAYRATRAARGARLGVRGGVGILYVEGPLVKNESWISGMLGLTTYETMRRDLQVMLDEDRLKALILRVDTPGGEVNGCSALAQAIYDARKKKPIYAYVSGLACSAGYWLASAAERIIVSESAVLGSIGVTMTATDTKQRDKAAGITRYQFVSSNAPNKAPDPASERGRQQYQKIVDGLAEVFIKYVAKHRGVSTDTVVNKFGSGGVKIGNHAVKAGMADEVGQFEDVLARLQKRTAEPAKAVAQAPTRPATAMPAPAYVAAPPAKPSAEEIARAEAAAEAERKARIDATWKKAAEMVNSGMGPNAVKSAI